MLTLVSSLLDLHRDEDGVVPVMMLVIAVLAIIGIITLFSFCGDGVDE